MATGAVARSTRGIALGILGYGLVGACSINATPTVAPGVVAAPVERIPRTILLLIPADFAEYSHTSAEAQYDFRFAAGAGAVPPLVDLLSRMFDSVAVEHVGSDAAAMLILSRDLPVGVDWVAMPKFVDTRSLARIGALKLEAGIRLDLMSRDRSRTLSAVGRGKDQVMSFAGADAERAGSKALERALVALRDDLVAKRGEL